MTAGDDITYGQVTREGHGYKSIVRAAERLILMRLPTFPNGPYPANFHGITDALWDLGNALQGELDIPGFIGIGPYPPGWDINNNNYFPGKEPKDGLLWYDTRQGRLFIAESKEWHQTNGGENFVHIGPEPPDRITEGRLWFCVYDGRTYVYIGDVASLGEPGWYEIGSFGGSSGSGCTISATAPLNPQNEDLWWNSTDGTGYIYYVDNTSGQWVAFTPQGSKGSSCTISPTAPPGPQNEDLWWNSTDGTGYIYYVDSTSGQWVPFTPQGGGTNCCDDIIDDLYYPSLPSVEVAVVDDGYFPQGTGEGGCIYDDLFYS